ncbi:MAG: SMC-Scp complex subunit ScpB [Bifidobacteriaceae bacterium]|jgi:segregation and condensation protein B|nr:SMC-Scp complex subunit ScpB [Bifidobacteriaceae bacterium]
MSVNFQDLEKKIEAALICSSDPILPEALAKMLDEKIETIEKAFQNLQKKYESNYGFILKETPLGFRFYTSASEEGFVKEFLKSIQSAAPLSISSLETLAIVAYKGPISRAEINSIRGVKSESTLRTLELRDLIIRLEGEGENSASLYKVSNQFLERMGISSTDQLAPLAPYLPEDLTNEESAELAKDKKVI